MYLDRIKFYEHNLVGCCLEIGTFTLLGLYAPFWGILVFLQNETVLLNSLPNLLSDHKHGVSPFRFFQYKSNSILDSY